MESSDGQFKWTGGRVLGRIRPIYMLSAGLLVGAIGTFAISGIHAHTGYLDLIWRLAIFGVANAMMLTVASVSAINAVPHGFAGMAAATNTALRQLGAALGPAVLGTIYAITMTQGAGTATTGMTPAMVATTGLLVFSSLACALSRILDRSGRRHLA